MSCNWENVTERQECIIRYMERRSFRRKVFDVVFICAAVSVLICMMIAVICHLDKKSIESEILGYDPYNPPKYSITVQYDEQKFYDEQKAEIEHARSEAVRQTKPVYGPYYVWTLRIATIIGVVIIVFFYWRLRAFYSQEKQISRGTCINREKEVYWRRDINIVTYWLDIQLAEGGLERGHRVTKEEYDNVKEDEDVVLVKLIGSSVSVDRVYPQIMFGKDSDL